MAKFMRLLARRRFWLFAAGIVATLGFGLLSVSSWQHPKGQSLLYGKVADTRPWIEGVGGHTASLLQHAKVTINSIPPQTTYTDDQGQFWFKGLRDIFYTLKVEAPYDRTKTYRFVRQVEGDTATFFDLIQDEAHNLHEIDY